MMRANSKSRRRPARLPAAAALANRDGFTIVEIIVAIMVLSVGVLGLAATAAVVQKQMGSGERQAAAAAIAQSRFDKLTSVNCATAVTSPDSATWRAGHVKEVWTVEQIAGKNVKQITETITITGYTNPLVYTTFIPCRII